MSLSGYSAFLVIASLIAFIMEPSDPERFVVVQMFVCTTLICAAIEKSGHKAGGGNDPN